MAQAYGARWVVQEDAMDGSLQAEQMKTGAENQSISTCPGSHERNRVAPPRGKRLFEESLRPGSFRLPGSPGVGSSRYHGNGSFQGPSGISTA